MAELNIDRDEAVEAIWPYDGPHSADSVQTAAGALPDLVRYLNNATGPNGQNLPFASHVGDAVGSTRGGVALLDQFIEQLGMALVRHSNKGPGMLYDDRGQGHDAGQTVAAALHHLNEAREALHPLVDALDEAHGAINHLGHRIPDEWND